MARRCSFSGNTPISIALFILSLTLFLPLAAISQSSDKPLPAMKAPTTQNVLPRFARTPFLAPSTVSLLPAVSYDSGATCTNAIAVADVNGDGHPDILVANGCTVINNQAPAGSVSVLMGNGDGTFQPASNFSSGGFDAISLAISDVNADGKPDLLVLNVCSTLSCASGVIAVLMGNGNGTFQSPVLYPVHPSSQQLGASLVVGDLTGNGKLDLVLVQGCTSGSCGSIGVLMGNGDGTFQPVVTASVQMIQPLSVVLSDVNADGILDILVAIQCADQFCNSGLVGVLLGKGDGTFSPLVTYDGGGKNTISIAVADVNADGKPDLLIANVCLSDANCLTGSVGVLFGNGDGTFRPVTTFPSGAAEAFALAVGDLNDDGILDLAVDHCTLGTKTGYSCPGGSGIVAVFQGNGDGTFQSPITHTSGGSEAVAVAIADLNGDGRPDLVVANNVGETNGDGTVGVLLNKSSFKTSTTLGSSLNPSIYGQAVIFTATVTGIGPVPTGTVVFTWGSGYTIGSAKLNSSGVATLTKSNLNADTYPLTAVYKGDANNLGSTSTIVNQVVQQTTSAATLTSSPNPSTPGQTVTFTAQITSSTVIPTGPVTFAEGKTVLATVQLSGGKAKFATSSLPSGSTTVSVSYLGNSNIRASTASVTQSVSNGMPPVFTMPYTGTLYLLQMEGSAGASTMFGLGTSPTNFVGYYGGLPNNPVPTGEVMVGTFTAGTVINFGMFSQFGTQSGWAFSSGTDQASIVAFTDPDNNLGMGGSITQQTSSTTWLLHLDDALSYLFDDDDNDVLMQLRVAPSQPQRRAIKK